MPLAPILVAYLVGLGKGVTYIAGERAPNGSLCVEQRCTQRAFFGLLGTLKKNAVKSRPQLVPNTSGLSHATRDYEKTHAHLNSVLEQALVTTAVGEAHCSSGSDVGHFKKVDSTRFAALGESRQMRPK